MDSGSAAILKRRRWIQVWKAPGRTGVQRRQHERQQGQSAARENQAQSNQLIPPVGAVLGDAPGPIERHFQRLENAVGGEQQQEHGEHLDAAARRKIAADESAEVARQRIVKRQVDGRLRRPPVQDIAAEREHDNHEGIERQQHTGGNGQRIDVRLSLEQIPDSRHGMRPPDAPLLG